MDRSNSDLRAYFQVPPLVEHTGHVSWTREREIRALHMYMIERRIEVFILLLSVQYMKNRADVTNVLLSMCCDFSYSALSTKCICQARTLQLPSR